MFKSFEGQMNNLMPIILLNVIGFYFRIKVHQYLEKTTFLLSY